MFDYKIPLLISFSLLVAFSGCKERERFALIETEHGNMKVLLYNSTPRHKENFIKLVNDGFFDGLLFHRVISNFMVQGGDPDSRDAAAGQPLGQGGPGYQIDAEIRALHFKGALAAARAPDAVNPEKKSSGSQFYIVQGTKMSDAQLDQMEQMKGIKYTDEQRKIYREIGGYPPLDEEYTVFGEVVEGLEVVDRIAVVEKDPGDRPVKDIRMTIKMLD